MDYALLKNPKVVAERGEQIYREKYQQEYAAYGHAFS
jgi:hypothetical protein